ncbi:MAG: hypothetical protein Q7T44_10900 [Parvibaculum sp.]|nr:hypothetical protein [Parvibaculum sp.]
MKSCARFTFISLIVFGAILGGCAKRDPVMPILALPQTKACAANINVGNPTPLAFDPEDAKAIDMNINEGASCYLHPDGSKSLYGVVALPEPGYEYILTVESYPQGSSIFSPRLLLLDANGKLLREFDRKRFMFRGAVLAGRLRVQPGERYLMVGTDAKGVGTDEQRITGMTHQNTSSGVTSSGVYYAMTLNTASETVQNLTYSYGGRVKVVSQAMPSE